jgi:multicomponent Na+:H+ antiporter subunit G
VTALLGWGLCSLAMLVLLVAAVGILRLPDALARQHASTKAGTLAVSLFVVGLALVAGEVAWTWRLLALVTFLLMTLPLASHALARAGVIERAGAQKVVSRLPGN